MTRALGARGYWAELLAAHPDPTRCMRVGSALVPVREVPLAALDGALCEEWYDCPETGEGDVFTDARAVILYASTGGSLVAEPVCEGCLTRALALLTSRGSLHATDVQVLRGVPPHVPTS